MSERWNQVRVLDKAVELLVCFTRHGTELSLTELAVHMNAPKGTVHRIASTLLRHGFLERNPHSRRYSLGNLTLVLSGSLQLHDDLKRAAQPAIARLVEQTGEGVNLSVVHQNKRLCIDVGESTQTIRFSTYVGQVSPLHAGASAKVLLAYQPEEVLAEILASELEACTDQTLTDPDALKAELARIRKSGYALSVSERVPGATSIAAPVFGRNQRLAASLSLAGPSYRFTPERTSTFIAQVIAAAQLTSERLGGGRLMLESKGAR